MRRLRPSLRRRLATLLFAAAASGAALPAQPIVLRAFGDSITDGYGDTSQFGGYAARLQRWLRQHGADATVTEHGVGGETTAQGLSRIDDVLDMGGDYLLLMEGTNDISKRVGTETIRFNLDQMASRAEELGWIAVHATVIPRIPTAPVDSDNGHTSLLAAAILDLGQTRLRAVADNFAVFEDLPHVFENYYYFDPDQDPPDPVGHPNSDGYNEIAGTFLEVVEPLLDGPSVQIVPPGSSGPAGVLLAFQVTTSPEVVRVEWDFGDGGFIVRQAPAPFDVFYIFRDAGTFTVTVRGFTALGAASSDSVTFHVQGGSLNWPSRFVLFPAVESASSGLVVSDLSLHNSDFSFTLAEVTLLPDVSYDDPPPPRRFLVEPESDLTIADIVASAFGEPGGRGAIVVELIADPNPLHLTSSSTLRSENDLDGSSGCDLAEIPSAQWSAAPKTVSGISLFSDETATVHVTNLDPTAGSVRLDLYDGATAFVGSALFDLAAGGSRQRELADLFRSFASHPPPLRAEFTSSGVRYAVAIVAAGHGEQVRCAVAAP